MGLQSLSNHTALDSLFTQARALQRSTKEKPYLWNITSLLLDHSLLQKPQSGIPVLVEVLLTNYQESRSKLMQVCSRSDHNSKGVGTERWRCNFPILLHGVPGWGLEILFKLWVVLIYATRDNAKCVILCKVLCGIQRLIGKQWNGLSLLSPFLFGNSLSPCC